MTGVIAALTPVFLLIAAGWAARAGRLAGADQFGAVNRIGYFLFYPAFLFTTITGSQVEIGESGRFLGGVLSGFLCIVALALCLRFFIKDGPAFTSVFQGSVRWNGFSLLAAAPGLYGAQGADWIALAFGPLILMINVICVSVLAVWGKGRGASLSAILDQILANPLVLACAAGLIAKAAHWGDLGPISATLKLLSAAAMPVALLCVGAGLNLGAVRKSGALVASACGLRLIAAPAFTYLTATLFGAGPHGAAIAAGIAATPTAAASYVLAREMGGDAELMAAIVTATTLLSFVTMPIAIALTLS